MVSFGFIWFLMNVEMAAKDPVNMPVTESICF